ncbi:MAG: riboflavin biosynthesis protein RibF [Bacteroidetes bacterium GWF2_42_66]|nr:MAG: riboflavin biosynthesis protein RibF [Bacteroidetes bacterium GWA2_42_15]OFX97861.1 MAG: riboflavin biosynthesis protein RibF [Bacteroidetes bacterium GWE2_42_39]OFY44162.1 MAG: riboflavin biosynthesis protein RibF [Bacteroidetes bacterium GWF2_42_66]HBL74590.1 riboflavin biosynthesis protein RibF [Prolixibacteraceae bacterium]HCR91530.1 riboflavin biosynthesis protein RibF [Prolixibacteraceae bacterium]
MKVYYDIESFRAINPAVTIGTFDGVHNGHKKVIGRLKELAAEIEGESVIFTFFPHPRLVLSPEEGNLRLLTTLDEKIRLLEEAGIDHLIAFPFTKEFSNLSYTDFVKTILVDKLNTRCLVIGYDHKFGKDREGGYEFLKQCADQYHFRLEKLDAFYVDDVNISSTKIRTALEKGNVGRANEFLGYRFTLHGNVVEGQKLGRRIQFPTANIEASDPHKIIPGYGVYAVTVRFNGNVYKGMLNIGTRPTVNTNADHRSIEVHIFDFGEAIYGKQIELCFYQKIREEQKFNSIDELKAQLEKDKVQVLSCFSKFF